MTFAWLHLIKIPRGSQLARTEVCFSGAPGLVLRERILSQDVLIPPFLGYTLFLAGLVFLNQLYTEKDASILDEHVEHLKTVFMALSAMREFYAPAHLWVQTLFQVHALERLPELSVVLNERFFARFPARWNGLQEPPYCPLDAGQVDTVTRPAATCISADYGTMSLLDPLLEREFQENVQSGRGQEH
ncbi:hypothetical protein AK830_g5078 [Neonectria ditissima]|uniref:Uncharacterized protein n=1 Tax=Neonectria ditissima TaxID=78410 RepID=A0A0P7BLL8_9HYPO|nr:hypothetical protein AK830_g5078 [Neonectria ditissima]